ISVNAFFFQAEDGIRDFHVTGVQTCALPISGGSANALLRPAAGLSRMRPAALSGLRHSLHRGAGKTRLNAEPWSTRCGRRGTRAVQERGALPRAAASPAGLGDVAFRGCGLVRVTHPSLFAPGLRGPAVAFTNYESRITNPQSPQRKTATRGVAVVRGCIGSGGRI